MRKDVVETMIRDVAEAEINNLRIHLARLCFQCIENKNLSATDVIANLKHKLDERQVAISLERTKIEQGALDI